MSVIIIRILWIVIWTGTLFASSSCFVDSQLMPKWFALIGGVLLLAAYSMIRIIFYSDKKREERDDDFIVRMIVFLIFFQAVYGVFQYIGVLSVISHFRVIGSFDNPAGFAASLCAGFPFFWYVFKRSKRGLRWIIALGSIVVITAVVLSESRAGILSLIVVLLFFIIKYFSIRWKWILLPILLVGIIVGLYYMKKDSADGRLFIWKCSLPMMEEHWLAGYGMGGFETHYMDYQANFFKTNPDSLYSGLADNVQYPFNEYIRIVVDYGVTGILLLIGWIGLLIYCYFKYLSEDGKAAILCCLSVGVFAAFSYPLMYSFVWLILLFSTWRLIKRPFRNVMRNFHPKSMKFFMPISVFFLLYISYQSYRRMEAEMEWAHVANLPLPGPSNKTLIAYQKLQEVLGKDRYFLYNYSVGLYEAGYYHESLEVTKKCRSVWADYDVELLLGELFEKLKDKKEAMSHYQIASWMCPNRFYPLYRQVLLLEMVGDSRRAKQLAVNIINKSEKIPSMRVRQIKDLLRSQYLQ